MKLTLLGISLIGAGLRIPGCEHWRQDSELPAPGVVLLSPPPFDDLDQPVDTIRSWLESERERAGYPSVSVAVVRGGRVVLALSSGLADAERGIPATPDTPYHVASVTKVFTATLAARLHEQKSVDLDAPALRYLPAGTRIGPVDSGGDAITLRHLASHTSGLPRSVPGAVQYVEGRYALDPELLYRHLGKVELLFAPGTAETYSNLGTGLLGHVLERATGKPFSELLTERLLAPLELTATSVSPAPALAPAVGYDRDSKRGAVHAYRRRLVGSGGLVSSANDLARFIALHLGHGPTRLLSPESLRECHRPMTLTDGTSARTGLGWSLDEHPRLGRLIEKNGGRHNAGAWIGFAPELGVGAVVLVNTGTRSVSEISDGEEGPVDPGSLALWLLERCVGDSIEVSTDDLVTEYPKLAPFTGVEWRSGRPFVQLQGKWYEPHKGKWYELLEIDSLSALDVVRFCEERYGRSARQRFAEDLVEVLAEMGHSPRRRVTLRVIDPATGDSRVLDSVEMTRENRDRVRSGG